ncbi:MAG: ribonuclease BN (tRNA processing enzyme) [Limisphaerales bacterium]|jgi:ribonuclease BN (tRNA processing enzyme)
MRVLLFLATLLLSPSLFADQLCGDTGVWVQILGSGGPELDDGQGGPSYLIWNDNKARVLIDTGPGSSVAFDKAEAKIEDLYAVLFTHLHADHAVDFPAFIKGSYFAERTEPLIVLGPDSNNPDYPDTESFITRLIGPDGAFPYLQDFLTAKSSGGYRIRPRNVLATGKKRWARFGNEELTIAAIPVNHGPVPALAWRIDVGDVSVVISGDFNNLKDVMAGFAKDADALLVSHAIPENSRGNQRELHVLPSQLGRIAQQAEARMLILSHRMNRTQGRESQTRRHIEENYSGYVLFANDMECWGL